MNPLQFPLVSLCAILVVGLLIGEIRLFGFRLGTMGVLFSAIFAGHYLDIKFNRELYDLSLGLFVYAVGLQAGPSFFSSLVKFKKSILLLSLVPLFSAGILTFLACFFLEFGRGFELGIFAGSLTSISALATAIDQLNINSTEIQQAYIGFGVTYPFSILVTGLLLNYLPKIMRRDLKKELRRHMRDVRNETDRVVRITLRVTNPNCVGLTLKELNARKRVAMNITSVMKASGECKLGSHDLALQLNDLMTVVTTKSEVHDLIVLIGSEVHTEIQIDRNADISVVEISEPKYTGRKLSELELFEKYHILVTDIFRQDVKFVATANSRFEMGDLVTVIGKKENTAKFAEDFCQNSKRKLEETSMLPFLLGLLLSALVSNFEFNFFGLFKFNLGLAGSAFMVGVLMSSRKQIYKYSLFVPKAARNLCRDLGLMIFLATLGSSQGSTLVDSIASYGFMTTIAGLIITLTTVIVTVVMSLMMFSHNLLMTIGYTSGVMNNSTAFANARDDSNSELPAICYASIYPVSLFLKIIIAELMILIV